MSGVGGRPGWAWIFILEGIFTVLFGIFSSFFIPSSPMNCRILKQEEKEYIMLRLREDGAISKDDRNDVFSWREVFRIFYLPHVWLLFFIFFFHGTSAYIAITFYDLNIVSRDNTLLIKLVSSFFDSMWTSVLTRSKFCPINYPGIGIQRKQSTTHVCSTLRGGVRS